MLNVLSQIMACIFILLVLCLALTCCQYKKVSVQYEAIRQTTADPEIVDRNARQLSEEEKPRKRARSDRPDPETFGVRSNNDRSVES